MAIPPNSGARRIVLIGMRAAGKTTVGRALARRLGRPFTDVDDVVAQLAGRPADEVLAQDGEPAFRALEERALRIAARGTDTVVATGGGAVLHREAFASLADGALVAWLDAPASVLAERAAQRPRPPLTDRPLPEETALLLASRAPLYREVADIIVPVGLPDAPDPILALLGALQEEPAP